MAKGQPSSNRDDAKYFGLIVEDHTIFAQAIARMLRTELEMSFLIAPTIEKATELVEQYQLKLAILDLELPDGNGLEIAELLAKQEHKPSIFVLAGAVNSFYCPPEIRQHLSGVVSKSQAYEELITALSPIAKPTSHERRAENPLIALTAREYDVYTLLGQGLSGKQISSALNLSANTIETHRKRIASKLGMSGAELIHHATMHWAEQRYQLTQQQR